jgi:hypothetical protein
MAYGVLMQRAEVGSDTSVQPGPKRVDIVTALGSGMGTRNKRQMSKVGALLMGGLASLLLVNAAWKLFEGDARNVVFSWVVIALCLAGYAYVFWAYRRAVKNPPTHD